MEWMHMKRSHIQLKFQWHRLMLFHKAYYFQFLKRYFKAIRIIWVFYQNRKCLDCLNSRSFDSKINGQCIGALGCMNIDSKTLAAKSIESKK